MAVHIRLSRAGAKKAPYYNIVVADSRMPRDGRFIEKIGTYNPMLARDNADRVKVDAERAAHWLKVGAQPTERVVLFLANAGLMAKPSLPKLTKKNQPKAKAQERLKAIADAKAKAAAEAAAAAAKPAEEAAPVAEETPAA